MAATQGVMKINADKARVESLLYTVRYLSFCAAHSTKRVVEALVARARLDEPQIPVDSFLIRSELSLQPYEKVRYVQRIHEHPFCFC